MPGVGLRQRGMIPRRPLHPDPSHPLAAGLIFCQFSGNEQGRAEQARTSWGQGVYGRASATTTNTGTGASGAFGVPLRRKWPSAGMMDWTMHSVVDRVTAVSQYAVVFEVPHNPTSGSWTSPYHAFAFGHGSTAIASVSGNDGTNLETLTIAGANYVATDGLPHSYTCSWGASGAIWWRDGVQWGTSATTPNGAALTPMVVSGAGEVVFGGRSVSTNGEGYTGVGTVQALWERRLSQLEIQMAHDDIFSLFRDGR